MLQDMSHVPDLTISQAWAGYLPEIFWVTLCVIITETAHSVPDFVCNNGPGWSCLFYRTEGHAQRHAAHTMSCHINITLGAGIFLVNPNRRLKNCKTVYRRVAELVRCFIIDFGSEEMELYISLIVNWAIIYTPFIMDPHWSACCSELSCAAAFFKARFALILASALLIAIGCCAEE
jgi:hypothetical protein